MIRPVFTVLLALAAVAPVAAAQPVGYAGRVTASDGSPLAGPVDLELHFFRSADGADEIGTPAVFAATPLTQGVFNVALDAAQVRAALGDGTQPLFVEVRAQGRTLPRQRFTAVPYALAVPVDGTTIGVNANGELTYVGSSGVTAVTATAPLAVTGSATAPNLTLPAANGSTNGYLSSADWTAFNGKQSSLGYTPVNKAGDTMTGALTVLTPTAAGHATPKSYVDAMLGGFALDQSAKNDQYVVKWDTAAGKFVLGADQLGAAGGGIQSINALNATAQTLAVGTAGTAPAWSSATSTHTLNLPMASAAGVTAGLLAKTDYDAFTAKQAAITAASTVNTGTLTTALQNGVELKPFNTAAGNTGELRFDELAANGANYVGFKAPDLLTANKIWTLPAADGTSGNVLQTDGSGNLSWIAIPAAPVTTVNGQTGAVSLTTSNVNEGANLYYTDARARGAISGTAPINVSGAGAISLANTAVTPGSYTRANITVDAQGRLTAAANGASVNLATESTGTLAVANGGTGATSFTNNGVLIGSGPSPLSATAAGTADQVLRIPGAGGAPAFGAVDLTKSAAVTGALPVANGGTGLAATGTANQLLGTNAAGNGLEYKTVNGTTNQITVSNAAGTLTLATPQDLAAASSPTFAGLTLSGTTGSLLKTTAGGAVAAASGSDLTTLIGTGAYVSKSGDAVTGNLTVSGNVGVGSATPAYKLDVNGDVMVGSGVLRLKRTDGGAAGTITNSTSDLFLFSKPVSTSGGVFGNASYSTASTSLTLGYNTHTLLATASAGNLAVVNSVGAQTGNLLSLQNGGVEKASIAADGGALFGGAVGIGTTAPNSKLQVVDTADAITQIGMNNLSTGTNAMARVTVSNPGNVFALEKYGQVYAGTGAREASYGGLIDSGNGINLGAYQSYGVLRFYTGGLAAANERMRVAADGKVGIGTASPTMTLDVNGTVLARAPNVSGQALDVYGRTSDDFAWAPLAMTHDGSAYTGGIQFTPSAVTLDAGSALTPAMTWLPSGNVGIGSSAPTAKLDVAGGIKSTMWKASHPIDNVLGVLPATGNFSSGGGTLLIMASGTAYTTVNGHVSVNIQVDGVVKGYEGMFMNETSTHKTMPTNTLIVTGIAAGAHTVTVACNVNCASDNNDHWNVTVLELPF